MVVGEGSRPVGPTGGPMGSVIKLEVYCIQFPLRGAGGGNESGVRTPFSA